MIILESILYGLCIFYCCDSIEKCYRSRYQNREELIPIILHTTTTISSNSQFLDIERIAPLIDETTIPEEDSCPICLEPLNTLRYKRRTQCGHTFCSECLHEWLRKKPNCPLCNHSFIHS